MRRWRIFRCARRTALLLTSATTTMSLGRSAGICGTSRAVTTTPRTQAVNCSIIRWSSQATTTGQRWSLFLAIGTIALSTSGCGGRCRTTSTWMARGFGTQFVLRSTVRRCGTSGSTATTQPMDSSQAKTSRSRIGPPPIACACTFERTSPRRSGTMGCCLRLLRVSSLKIPTKTTSQS